ncbi:MAG: HAD family hydrolase [Acidimicrobiales bacterium]
MSDARISLHEIDAAVVDLDGVVTDTAGMHAAAWAELFDRFLVVVMRTAAPFDREDDYLRYVDGKPRADGVASFLASRGMSLPWGHPGDPPSVVTVCGLGNRKDELFRERLRRDGVRVFPDAIAFLRGIRAAGRPVAVVSASRNCQEVLAAGGVRDLFDVIVDGVVAADHALPGKPDPATFLFAVAQLGTVPARTLLLEDSLAGIEAGRRGGFHPIIAVDRHDHSAVLRSAGADLVIGDLAELTTAVGPDHGD